MKSYAQLGGEVEDDVGGDGVGKNSMTESLIEKR